MHILARPLAVLAVAALAWLLPVAGHATSTALVIAIDASGSIDQTEFDLQKQAYAAYFSNNAAAFAGADVAVTVAYWAGDGVQVQAVPWTNINDAASADAFANSILATTRPDLTGSPNGAQTGVARALDFATSLITSQNFNTTNLVIDISGDGTENLDTFTSAVLDTVMIDIPGFGMQPFDIPSQWGEVFAARQNALDAGILVNALPIIPVPVPGDPNFAVETQDSSPASAFFPAPMISVGGNPVDISAEWAAALAALGYDTQTLLELFYSRVIGSPDARIPLLIIANGFTAQELGDKISQKLSLELGVPEPGTVLLIGLGLGVWALRSRPRA